jgi:hypothetical protein
MSINEARARKIDQFSSSIFSQSTSEEWSRQPSITSSSFTSSSPAMTRYHSEKELRYDAQTAYKAFVDRYGAASRGPL